jgi:hypothetical protein
MDERTVSQVYRALREADLLTQGARGVNAPHMTSRDFATMTITLLATDRPARAVEMVRRFGRLRFDGAKSNVEPHPVILETNGDTLLDAVERLFAADLDVCDPFAGAPYLELQVNARTASIAWQEDRRAVFNDLGQRDEETRKSDLKEFFGRRVSVGFSSSELTEAYVQLFLERRAARSVDSTVE